MVIATLFVPHSDCTHQPSPARLQNTRKKGSSLSFSGGGAKVTAAARGISSDWGLVSALLSGGHFTFCAEAEKCQELGIRMRRGWRKVMKTAGVVKCAAAPGISLHFSATPQPAASPHLHLSSQTRIKGFVII